MKTFTIWYRMTSMCSIDIDAETEAEALEIARNTDGGHFACDDMRGSWEFDSIEK